MDIYTYIYCIVSPGLLGDVTCPCPRLGTGYLMTSNPPSPTYCMLPSQQLSSVRKASHRGGQRSEVSSAAGPWRRSEGTLLLLWLCVDDEAASEWLRPHQSYTSSENTDENFISLSLLSHFPPSSCCR